MNTFRMMTVSAVVSLLALGQALPAAPIGTAKARGDYRPFAQTQRSSGSQVGRSFRPTYAYRAPAVRRAPTAVVVQPSIVRTQVVTVEPVQLAPTTVTTVPQALAQTNDAGRRFSYTPTAAPTTASAPCPEASAAPAVNEARRFSYSPSVESVPASATPRSYRAQPSYPQATQRTQRTQSRSRVENYLLQKTDPRKYSTR
jgi:hypothetical protein